MKICIDKNDNVDDGIEVNALVAEEKHSRNVLFSVLHKNDVSKEITFDDLANSKPLHNFETLESFFSKHLIIDDNYEELFIFIKYWIIDEVNIDKSILYNTCINILRSKINECRKAPNLKTIKSIMIDVFKFYAIILEFKHKNKDFLYTIMNDDYSLSITQIMNCIKKENTNYFKITSLKIYDMDLSEDYKLIGDKKEFYLKVCDNIEIELDNYMLQDQVDSNPKSILDNIINDLSKLNDNELTLPNIRKKIIYHYIGSEKLYELRKEFKNGYKQKKL